MINSNKKILSDNIQVSQSEAFLQSLQWGEFQKKFGRAVFLIKKENFKASLIEHTLPIVGKYFYCPRGPVFCHSELVSESNYRKNDEIESGILKQVQDDMVKLIDLAKKENAGWIRIEPGANEILDLIKNSIEEKIVRAPHDMQPKEIFAIDITKTPEQLLAEMKPKTRYNIGLAKKKNVLVTSHSSLVTGDEKEFAANIFLKLTKEMAQRNGIATHVDDYYRKMIKSLAENLKIYLAEYKGEIIAANLVLFYEKTAIYLHGASGNSHRNVMAPFLLQWQAILDAKEIGCKTYNFGGVETPGVKHQKHSSLVGVTNFKLGFSTTTKTIEFPGSYDIIVNSRAYWIYRGLQRAKSFAVRFRK